MVIYKFHGDDLNFIVGVPRRDLTQDDFDRLDEEAQRVLKAGHKYYERIEPTESSSAFATSSETGKKK